MKRIVITGANGQLGQELRELSRSYPQFEFIFLTKVDLEISDDASVKKFFSSTDPHFALTARLIQRLIRRKAKKIKHS